MSDQYQADGTGWRAASPDRALVIHPVIKTKSERIRDPQSRLEEARRLALAIALDVVHAETVTLHTVQPSTLIGSGVATRFAKFVHAQEIDLVIMDTSLSPIQQRNLEKTWNCKVIDRTGLILEIFGARARTHEGRLQVELAAMNFQRSRLVRSWTHLERQRGGLGFIGGPGESQLEIDRRLIDERIAKLKRQLESVRKTRQIQRAARKKIPYPIVALVGYTNAGKSTLFNFLTNAGVLAKDLLFATLDPTMRQINLPSGRKVILSDTVGFISDLPTDLVAAFRATLEEVCEADIVLHIRDIASPESQEQKQDVLDILKALDLPADITQIEVLNKTDLLTLDERKKIQALSSRQECQISLSAGRGENVAQLLDLLDRQLALHNEEIETTLQAADGKMLAWIYENGNILSRIDDQETGEISLRVSFTAKMIGRFRAMGKP